MAIENKTEETEITSNFIHDFIDEDIAQGGNAVAAVNDAAIVVLQPDICISATQRQFASTSA